METKECNKCRESKPVSAFNKRSSSGALRGECRACSRPAATSRAQKRTHTARAAGLSVEEYTAAISGPCSVCGHVPGEADKLNGVYMNRHTNKMTGVVCSLCARGLGMLDHDPERIRAALVLVTYSIE